VRLRAVVRGDVQMVGFRDFASRQAQRRGLTGYVRNLSDGSLEVEAEGPRTELEGLLGALQEGPPLADVEDVDVLWEDAPSRFSRWELHW
jgi:acylphosphatase